MKILKIVCLFFTLSAFSIPASAMSSQEQSIIRHIQRIATLLEERKIEGFKEISNVEAETMQLPQKNLEELEQLLVWFRAYVKAENNILIHQDSTYLEQFVPLPLGIAVFFYLYNGDPLSALVAAVPAYYFTNKVLAPNLKDELLELQKQEIPGYPQRFDIANQNPEAFQKIVGMADLFYRFTKKKIPKCEYAANSTHCRVQRKINQRWYKALFFWKKNT